MISAGLTAKKRILFIDGDPRVLESLQRLLHPMRQEWEMEFFDSGPKALVRLAQGPVDAIVSEMRMAGMDGERFLREVMQRQPATVRIILSGFADKGMVQRCVGAAHQCLPKPCPPESLKTAIHRAAARESSVKNTALKKLIPQIEHLPTVPSLFIEIVEKLNDPEAGIDEIGQIVSRDVGMTAQILKLVNSVYFGLPHPVSSPAEAIHYLGAQTVKWLVLSLHAFSQFSAVDQVMLEHVRTHSLEVAAAAKAIALSETGDRSLADESFVAGMLHDTGKVILLANFGDWRTHSNPELRGLAAEESVFGANHADFGGYLLGLWGLPESIVEAIALHHAPASSVGRNISVMAVHAANALVRERNALSRELPSAPLDFDYLERAGVAQRVEPWRALVGGFAS
jgi:HD-like signal output (HDOD) protein/CheY-like chemotaxis protein